MPAKSLPSKEYKALKDYLFECVNVDWILFFKLLALAAIMSACQPVAEDGESIGTGTQVGETQPAATATDTAAVTPQPTATATPPAEPTATPTAPATAVQVGRGGLVGPTWLLVSLGPADSQTPAVPDSMVTLQFQADGQASGSSGCNLYFGPYQLQAGAVSFGRLTTTDRPCAVGPVAEQEQVYLLALGSAGAFEVTAEGLTIWYADGQNALHFVRSAE